jgi:NTE family protein
MGLVVALGGGGIRGIAHLAILKALRREGIPIRALAGSSAGALASAMYAFDLPLDPHLVVQTLYDPEVERLVQAGTLRQMARLVTFLRKPHLSEGAGLRGGYARLFGEQRLEESPIPLALVAADLRTGEAVALREGLVSEALKASSAIPSVFPPVAWDGRILVDGDVAEKVPVTVARSLAPGPVLAVDISNPYPPVEPKTALEAALQAGEASRRRLLQLALDKADLVIRLEPPQAIETFDTSQAEYIYQLGQQRIEAALPAIRELLQAPEPAASRRWWEGWLRRGAR